MTELDAMELACPYGVAPKCIGRRCMGFVWRMADDPAETKPFFSSVENTERYMKVATGNGFSAVLPSDMVRALMGLEPFNKVVDGYCARTREVDQARSR